MSDLAFYIIWAFVVVTNAGLIPVNLSTGARGEVAGYWLVAFNVLMLALAAVMITLRVVQR